MNVKSEDLAEFGIVKTADLLQSKNVADDIPGMDEESNEFKTVQNFIHELCNNYKQGIREYDNEIQHLQFVASHIGQCNPTNIQNLIEEWILNTIIEIFLDESIDNAIEAHIIRILRYIILNTDNDLYFISEQLLKRVYSLMEIAPVDTKNELATIFSYLIYHEEFDSIVSPDISYNFVKMVPDLLLKANIYNNINKKIIHFHPDFIFELINYGFDILVACNDANTANLILNGIRINLSCLDDQNIECSEALTSIITRSGSIDNIINSITSEETSFNSLAILYFLIKLKSADDKFIGDIMGRVHEIISNEPHCDVLNNILKFYSKVINLTNFPIDLEIVVLVQNLYFESNILTKDQIMLLIEEIANKDRNINNIPFNEEFIEYVTSMAIEGSQFDSDCHIRALTALFYGKHPSFVDIIDSEFIEDFKEYLEESCDSNDSDMKFIQHATDCLMAIDTLRNSRRSYDLVDDL